MMLQKKLGLEKAELVLKAFGANQQHFGFIKVKTEELAELPSLYSPNAMPLHRDVYSFRAGAWMVVIVTHEDWVEVTLLNPYDADEHYTTSAVAEE